MGLCLGGLTLLAPAEAAAQTPPADAARARDLAVRGRLAFDRGDLAAGCPLLEEAYRLDGQLLGVGYALAECQEKQGRLASARALFLEVAEKAAARGEAREQEARARAAALDPRVSRLLVDVSERAAARPDLVVEVDGQAWPREAWGKPAPIDGGSHQVTARAEGAAPWSQTIEVAGEGASVTATVPFDREVAAPPPPPAPPPPAEEPAGDFPWRTAGLVTGGVGVGVLGLGVVLGLVAKGDYDAVESDCDASNACTPDAAAAREDARGLAHVGTALFVAGGVVAAAGITVFLLAPDDDAPAAAVRVGPGSVEAVGRF